MVMSALVNSKVWIFNCDVNWFTSIIVYAQTWTMPMGL